MSKIIDIAKSAPSTVPTNSRPADAKPNVRVGDGLSPWSGPKVRLGDGLMPW